MVCPTIVVVAFNRPISLNRLLVSLVGAVYPSDIAIRLVISIDGGGENQAEVQRVAETASWSHGEKEIIIHSKNLGLIGHLFACGDLSQRYGSIVLLEDDLIVSASYFSYASQALTYYQDDQAVAGISLNGLWFNGFNRLPFTPYLDRGDIFFMQIAWFQGQAYTAAQWDAFRTWFAENDRPVRLSDGMHRAFTQFAPTEWFPRKTRYLVETDRFYVFPRESLTVNFGEIGTHFAQQTTFFQVPIQHGRRRFRFQSLEESVAVYDSFQEMLPSRVVRLAPQFAGYRFVTDFYGEREAAQILTPFVLTTQRSTRPIECYGLVMRPAVENVRQRVMGEEIVLTKTADLDQSRWGKWQAERTRYRYFARTRPRGWRQRLKLFWL